MKKRIKFYTRSFDLRLYELSKGLYEGIRYDGKEIPCVRLTDQSADGYFYTMLKDTDCDIAINIDEDAFVTDPAAMLELVDVAIKEGYANIGYSDGNPATTNRDKIVTNPFFNIFNLDMIRSRFDKSLLKRDYKDAEPYYPFFKWMASEFKTLYLPCEKHFDGITTVAKDFSGRVICLHTWFSRFYSMPSWVVKRIEPRQGMQKARINAVIEEAYAQRCLPVPVFGITDNLIFTLNKAVRWAIKVPQRVSRWPYKIRRKLAKRL